MQDTTTQQGGTDMQALNLTHAIALSESGVNGKPNYNAVGDNGTSHGAYQWQPGNFEIAAKKFGLDPTDMSPENQDKVAYAQVKDYKDKGYQPAEIASLWNSGSPDNWKDHSGTTTINGKTIAYDTPAYVQKVKNYYQQLNQPNGAGYVQPPAITQSSTDSTPTDTGAVSDVTSPQGQSLGGQIANRVNSATGAVADTLSGKINPISGVLQTAGAVAGGLGDVVNSALEHTPVIGGVLKGIEGIIGTGVKDFVQTPVGQSVVQHLSDFAKTHPELSSDIGAGVNIITAWPILKGIGAIKNVVLDSASSVLKNNAENIVGKEVTSVVNKTANGSEFLMKNPDAVKNMIQERLQPEIVGTSYDSIPSFKKSQSTIKSLNNDVTNSLNKYKNVKVDNEPIMKDVLNGYTDKNGIAQEALSKSEYTPEDIFSIARELVPGYGKLWTKFEEGDASVPEINELRSQLDRAVQTVYSKTTLPPARKDIGATLAGAMRKYVQTVAPETVVPFNRMTNIYKVQKVLKYMNKKPVKPGMIGGFIKNSTSGVPILGHLGNIGASKLAKVPIGILKRTGVGAIRTTAKELKSKTSGLVKGALLQKVVPNSTQNSP